MENLLGYATDDEDFIDLINVVRRERRQKIYRQRTNHFQHWNDEEYLKRFRLSKNAVRFLHRRIQNEIRSPTDRNHAVSTEDMIMVTLRYYATGSFLQVVGDFIGIDKSTASRIVTKVSRAIARLHHQFIKMPETHNEMRIVSEDFYRISRFPKCIGALDCTHIKIISPGGNEPEVYRNRKGFFSMNVQAICDATAKFQSVICRWPGSSHDATIFNNSRVRAQFENGDYGDKVLVGDSGYGIKSYLITPLANPRTPAEQLFNEAQIRTRNPIERSFGIWKRRFPILAYGIRLRLDKVEAVVVATAILHNIALLRNDPLPPLDIDDEFAINLANDVIQVGGEGGHILNNNLIRNQLINEYFQQLVRA